MADITGHDMCRVRPDPARHACWPPVESNPGGLTIHWRDHWQVTDFTSLQDSDSTPAF